MKYPAWARLDSGGVLVGLVLVGLSMTPSMLPRPAYYQGIVSGFAFALGYAIGMTLWTVLRKVIRWRSAWLTRYGWTIIVGVWLVTFVVLVQYATRWQNGVRTTVGMDPLTGYEGWLILIIAVATAAVLIAIGRAIAKLFWAIVRKFRGLLGEDRRRGNAMAVCGAAVVVGVGFTLAFIALATAAVLFLDNRWDARNAAMHEDTPRPTSQLTSGGPGSLIAWEDVGSKGRSILANGPTVGDIENVTGQPAIEPIRIYIGFESAPTYAERADLAVRELERTHAEDRAVVVIPGLTGTGWLEPQAIDALEYLHGGDTAMVAAQYSTSPSWVSSMFHPDQSIAGTSALVSAVHAWWADLPEDNRPQLVVYGLSLGAAALQSVYGTPDSLIAGVEGAVFAGTPSGTPLDEHLRASRDPGTTAVNPVLSATPQVRYFSDSPSVEAAGPEWLAPRIAYLEHGNDPVVWVNWSIFYRKPEWLSAGQRSDAVSPDMHYIPIVTGLQSLADMAMAGAVPDDAGHKYGDSTFLAWVAITGNSGLEADALQRVRSVLATYDEKPAISQ